MTARRWKGFHLIHLAVWAILAVPSLWLWRESLVWIVFMSHYAILYTIFAGWQGARAEQAAEESSG